MMPGRVLPLPVAKEVRALLPVWLGSLAVVAAAAAVGDGSPQDLGRLVYGAACAALGALSIGHEYTNRTLATLLSQPVSRARLFLIKQSVLAVMLVTLSALAWNTVFQSRATPLIFVLSVLCAWTVTPWLTMLSRSPLAGAVFTGPAPAWIWLLTAAFVDSPWKLAVFGWAVLGLCAVAAVLGWQTFMRLEAIEGRGANLFFRLKAEATREEDADAAARIQDPIWLLAKKELALQLPSIAVAGIYVLGWLALWLWGLSPATPAQQRSFEDVLGALTFLHGGLVAIVIGSIASAEERQLGTLEWQVLLPMASWRQWAMKAGVALGLSMFLTVALPLLSLLISGSDIRIGVGYTAAMLLLTSVGLYASSLSANGLKAVLLTLPASLLMLVAIMALQSAPGGFHLTLLPMGFFALLVALVLYFALLNHRSAERGARRIGLQLLCLAGGVALGGALVAAMKILRVP
jgi:hypothetical protein